MRRFSKQPMGTTLVGPFTELVAEMAQQYGKSEDKTVDPVGNGRSYVACRMDKISTSRVPCRKRYRAKKSQYPL